MIDSLIDGLPEKKIWLRLDTDKIMTHAVLEEIEVSSPEQKAEKV